MRRSVFARARKGVALVAAILMLGTLAGPAAGASDPIFTSDFGKGEACQDFALRITGYDGPGGSVFREFADRNGNVVRTIGAGTGSKLVYTNLTSWKSLTTRSNGSGAVTRIGPDGLQTVAAFGHWLIILFPSDFPPGPTTTLYVGRVVFTIDSAFTFTLLGSAGTRTDICAALS